MRIVVADNGPGIPAASARARVRAVLHDQADRRRHGRRPGGEPRHRRGARRDAHGALSGGRRRGIHDRAAGGDRATVAVEQAPHRGPARANERSSWSTTRRRFGKRWPRSSPAPDIACRTAVSGREALARMAEEHHDVILSDLRMPDLDGRALYAEIERRWPGRARRVVFVTGDTLTAALAEFVAASGRPVIEKPFLPSEVQSSGRGTPHRRRDRGSRLTGRSPFRRRLGRTNETRRATGEIPLRHCISRFLSSPNGGLWKCRNRYEPAVRPHGVATGRRRDDRDDDVGSGGAAREARGRRCAEERARARPRGRRPRRARGNHAQRAPARSLLRTLLSADGTHAVDCSRLARRRYRHTAS